MQRPTIFNFLSQLQIPFLRAMEEETVNHLFSCFISLFTLILLYFPIQFLLSPVLLLSGALIVSLLHLGSTREPITRPGKIHEKTDSVNLEDEPKESETKLDSFVEWDFRAPLEVIHEAYEGDDDDEEDNPSVSVSGEKDPTRFREIDRFPLLSLYYPESDSESDSDSDSDFNFPLIGDSWISPEKMGLRWDEEYDGGLIEIKLDEYNRKININRRKWNQTEIDFHAEEEEGLIEIDIFS